MRLGILTIRGRWGSNEIAEYSARLYVYVRKVDLPHSGSPNRTIVIVGGESSMLKGEKGEAQLVGGVYFVVTHLNVQLKNGRSSMAITGRAGCTGGCIIAWRARGVALNGLSKKKEGGSLEVGSTYCLLCHSLLVEYALIFKVKFTHMNVLSSSTKKHAEFFSLNVHLLRKYQFRLPFSHAYQAGARSTPITGRLLRNNCVSMASVSISASVSASAKDYSEWSSEKLVERVLSLEQQLREQTARYVQEKSKSGYARKGKKIRLAKSNADFENNLR